MNNLENIAKLIRYYSLVMSTEAGSGHPTSSLSAADLMTGLLFGGTFKYDPHDPGHPNNDRLIFSKGHASPLFYSLWAAAGKVTEQELLSFRKFDSPLEGHPTRAFRYTEAATGSLGQGLSIGAGMALNAKYLDKLPYRTYVLLGDSEMAEGSQWEAMELAAYYKLNNLIGIMDVNRLGQRGETMYGHDLTVYKDRVSAFGWEAIVIDGHHLPQILTAYKQALQARDRPVMIIARTIKGKGVSFIEDKNGWHGRPLPADMAQRAVAALGGERNLHVTTARPDHHDARPHPAAASVTLPRYEVSSKVATRKAYGDALVALGARPEVVALDGEVGNSTYAGQFAAAYPDRFFEMFIAEQQLIAAAVGLAVRGYMPFASTFAAFFSRGYDFLRMAGISGANIKLCGSHAGTEIGPDGPSQMALEDLAAMRAIHGSTVLYPADATAAAALTAEMAATPGIVYLRTTRGAWPVLYPAGETFPAGGSKVLRAGRADEVTLAGAGVTVHQSLRAADDLTADGIAARVIDLYSVKPLDHATLAEAAAATGGRLVIAEDHYPQGGLGAAVLEALAGTGRPLRVRQCAVGGLPGSGTPDELMDAAGISASRIAAAARELIKD